MKKCWRSERVDDDEGEITYEAHGYVEANPELSSLVIFEGPSAKEDCDVFMKAVSQKP